VCRIGTPQCGFKGQGVGTPARVAGVPAVGGCAYTLMGQLVLMAVSSTTKEVCSEESSVPVNFTVMVVPAKLPSE
jgi:hypothetical protein